MLLNPAFWQISLSSRLPWYTERVQGQPVVQKEINRQISKEIKIKRILGQISDLAFSRL